MVKPPTRTAAQKTTAAGVPKAGEVIEVAGLHSLEAADRMLLNALYQTAHDSGHLTEPGARWTVALADLRSSAHESNDRLRQSLRRVLTVTVEVAYADPTTGDAMVLQTHLFESFLTPVSGGTHLSFAMPADLRAVLARSSRWGRIAAEIVCAMTSKYAIALYELLALRLHMERCVETISVDRIRAVLGVPPGAYARGNDLARFVLKVAALEVNGLSDIGVAITSNRRNTRAPITSVTLAWWRKSGDDYRAAVAERRRSKVGRMARLTGQAEIATTPG